jgi:hypothetical protein
LVNGKPWRRSFDPSREAYDGLLPTDSDLVPPRRIRAAEGRTVPGGTPQLTLAELTAIAADEPSSVPTVEKDRTNCNVYGNLYYLHGTQKHAAAGLRRHRLDPGGARFGLALHAGGRSA